MKRLVVEWDTNSNAIDGKSDPAIMVIEPSGTQVINDHELTKMQIVEAEQAGVKLDGLFAVTRWFVGSGRNTIIRIVEGERWD